MISATGHCNESQPSTSSSIESSQPCRHFEYPEILLATNNFEESLVIGRGGFGKVYKGNITNGSSVVTAAIKRLDPMSSQGASEFWAEVEMLSKLRHCHLVSLIGYCNSEKERILIYEYMPNGTLEDHLHKLGTPLSWLQRLKICIGATRGLDYLHTGTGIDVGIIHRDVKSSNILLHESWAAKISDFGLSKTGPTNQPLTYVSTLVKGTFGYIDPHYFSTGRITRKSDVYAFGVVLFEVLCKKSTSDESLEEGLATWVQDSIKEGKLKDIIDSDIRDQISTKCLKGFAQIAGRCLLSNPKQRPTMAEVVVSLNFVLTLQEKTNTLLQASGKTIFGKMLDMFPSPSNGENSADGDLKLLGNSKGKNRNAGDTPGADNEHLTVPIQSLKVFKFADLKMATRHFSKSLNFGRNDYGEVFSKSLNFGRNDYGEVFLGQLSVGSDIYSFGAVLLETLTGQQIYDVKRLDDDDNLITKATPFLEDIRELDKIMDPHLLQNYSLEGAFECATLILRCVAEHPEDRPSSEEILQILERIYAGGDLKLSSNSKANKSSTTPTSSIEFTFADLKRATRSFSQVLGTERFGRVFLGWVDKSTFTPSTEGVGIAVLVKQYGEDQVGYLEWQRVVKVLRWLAHPNIIRLLGYCNEKPRCLLVYEYMQNQNFGHFLFGDVAEPLSWGKRVKIMIGIARGLSYMHSLKDQVIHGDVKSSSIMLDQDFNAKLGGLEAARSAGSEIGISDVTFFVGTFGYMDPNDSLTKLSVGSDIYSFGVVLLETLTGRRAFDAKRLNDDRYLIKWASPFLAEQSELKKIMDPRLQQNYSLEGAFVCAALALRCVVLDSRDRPSSREVLRKLEQIYTVKKY